MSDTTSKKQSIKKYFLIFVFLFALFMGPGPGAMLIPPNSVFGWPALYLWTVFWGIILGGTVTFSAISIWSKEGDDG